MPLLTKKFEYLPLKRKNEDGKRLYTTPSGQAVASVTTILDATKPKEKVKALKEWKERVGTEKAKKITTEAANRGTKMHSLLEGYVENGILPERTSNPFSWPAHAMAKAIIDNGLSNVNEVWGVEIGLYFPQLYAGTTDLVGVHDSAEAIMDHKQTNKPKNREWIEDYFLQLVAYGLAHDETYGTKIKKGVIFMSVKPKVDESTGHLLSDPEYQEFILEGKEYDKYVDLWWKRVEQFYLL
jgi:hypothetical protein